VLLTAGLSATIDAINQSRKIFRRMTSCAAYRVAETVRVLLFMTLSILVSNLCPVTAVMIVLLALLNDGAVLSIACDRVHYLDRPEPWRARFPVNDRVKLIGYRILDPAGGPLLRYVHSSCRSATGQR